MTQTYLIHPHFKRTLSARSADARLAELAGLAHAIDLNIVGNEVVRLDSPRPSSLFGKGKVEEIAHRIQDLEVALVVVDGKLSPVQQRNLEKVWGCKVIDRTALILEIFGERAATAEGKLQVELAALEYQKSRLVRSWTHLERQRGGFGFMGGPGESQIEIDRRLIRDRIAKIKRELETVVRTRELHRKKRRSAPYPIIALVGYTNAGKSTLFNRLTKADVLAMDKLFATLDPTMRALKLPHGTQVILSDTVGFVSDLPHELVAAFRATLEEVLEADVLLHVRDISHEDTEAQKADVESVLSMLYGEEERPPLIEVWNKVDLVEHAPIGGGIAISALTGEGTDTLMEVVEETITRAMRRLELRIPAGEGEAMAWLHANGSVLSEEVDGDSLLLCVLLSSENAARFEKRFGLPLPALA